MTTGEKVELALIPIVGVTIWMLAPELPHKMGTGTLLLWASALLLFQSLVRDVWLLKKAKQEVQITPTRKLSCMCVESTVGATGVVIGVVLLGLGLDHPIAMTRWTWSVLGIITMTTGFSIKDYVVQWNPWRLRRGKDHLNIVFTWKV